MAKDYEVIVERRVQHRFQVTARSGQEASMKVGMLLAGTDPFLNTVEVELDRKILQPKIVHDAEAAPAQLDLAPAEDPIAARAAEVESLADAGLDPR